MLLSIKSLVAVSNTFNLKIAFMSGCSTKMKRFPFENNQVSNFQPWKMDSSLRRSRLSRYSEKWPIILGCYTGLIVIGLMFNLLIGEMYKVDRPHVTKNGTEYTVNAVLNDPNGLIMVQVEAVNSEIRMRYVGFGYDSAVKPVGFDFAEKLVIKDKAVILHSYFDR